MEENMDKSGQDKELAAEVADSVDEPESSMADSNQGHESMGGQGVSDPLFVQKRLKQQKRAHDREMREMQARMQELQAQVGGNPQIGNFDANPYTSGNGSVDETIQKAVSFALRQREEEERKAKAAESAAHIGRQYQTLQSHLDKVADKYDDFDEVVRGDSTPFTAHMRDAALMLPKKGPGSAGEVLYKLGKNPEELNRIAKLHPVDQAAELVALSHALISGGEKQGSSRNQPPLGQIKSNPVVNSVGVNEKTSPSEIRALMKAGKFR